MSAPHGTDQRYQAGCRCQTCKAAHVTACKRYQLARARAGRHLKVDASPSRELLVHWHDEIGWGWAALARATGAAQTALALIADGRSPQVRQLTADRIARPDWQAAVSDPRGKVPSYGVTRRLQALRTIGITQVTVGQWTGISESSLVDLTYASQPQITGSRWRMIDDVYRAHEHDPIALGRTRSHAVAQGWAPPAAWDDIDDPDEHPTGIRGRERTTVSSDDLVDLIEHGCILADLEERYGCTANTVYEGLRRAGRGDLWARIRAPRRGGVQHAA